MFSSWPPRVRVFDGEAVLVELWRVRCNQACETLTCRVNHVQITVWAVIPAQANIRAGGLIVGGVHLDQRRQREETRKSVICLKTANHDREVTR